MTESAGALGVPTSVVRNVEDDVVRVRRSGEPKLVSGVPGVEMVATGRVSAHADPTHKRSAVVKCEPSAEHVNPADSAAYHRVVVRAIVLGASPVGDVCANRIAVLQTVEAAARLDQRVQVGGRQRKAGETEGVGRIGLLRGNDAAAGPLRAPVAACERDGADNSVPVV